MQEYMKLTNFLEYSKRIASLNLTIVDYSTEPKHYLTACMKPLYLNADWIGLLQYFETWRALGITKFIIYVQQISPEVDEILKIYEMENILERVPYGYLPTTESHMDVNANIFFLSELMVLNDCLLRSRGHSKWVTMADFDEIIADVSGSERNLPELIKHLAGQYKNATGFLFRSTKTSFRKPAANDKVELKDLSFNYLADIKRNSDIWPGGMMSRMVVRPECITRINVSD